MATQLYDLRNVLLTIGGIPMGAYGNNDAAILEWADDIKYSQVSADGQPVVSRVNDPRLFINLTFMQTSGSIPVLQAFQDAQDGLSTGIAPPIIAPLPLTLLNFTTGDFCFSVETVFMNRIAPPHGKSVGEVGYRVLLPQPTYDFGSLNRNSLVVP